MADFNANQPVPVSIFFQKSALEEFHPASQPWPGGSGGSPGATTTFYMRGFDTTLAAVVFWTATFLDSSGSAYAGPGPLTSIVLIERIC